MSISNTTSRVQYTVTSAGATYNVTFRFYENTDLTVVHTSTAGVDTTLVYSVGYSVLGAGEEAGGQITLLDLTITDGTLTITRTAPLDQEVTAPLTPASVEEALDRLAMHTQQLQRQIDRSVRFSDVSASATASMVKAASKLVGTDSSGNPTLIDPASLSPDFQAAVLAAQAAQQAAEEAEFGAEEAEDGAVAARNEAEAFASSAVLKTGGTMSGELILPYAKFDGTVPAHTTGRVFYDVDENTLCYYNDVSGVTVNLGREMLVRVRNATGSTITNGSVVYISGALGQNPTASLARADAEATSRLIGMATHDIANNSVGYVTCSGEVHGLNTAGFLDGATVYLSASTAGAITATTPSLPNFKVTVGVVLYSHGTQGKILIRPSFESISSTNIQDSTTVGRALLTASSEASARGAILAERAAWVNVKDFGAVGDGSTDDTTAIQNAFNYAASLASSVADYAQFALATVFIPHGVYNITSQLTWGKHHIVGDGALTSVLQWAGTSSPASVLLRPSYPTASQSIVHLRGIWLNAKPAINEAYLPEIWVDWSPQKFFDFGCVIEDVHFGYTTPTGYALKLSVPINVQLQRVRFAACKHCIYCELLEGDFYRQLSIKDFTIDVSTTWSGSTRYFSSLVHLQYLTPAGAYNFGTLAVDISGGRVESDSLVAAVNGLVTIAETTSGSVIGACANIRVSNVSLQYSATQTYTPYVLYTSLGTSVGIPITVQNCFMEHGAGVAGLTLIGGANAYPATALVLDPVIGLVVYGYSKKWNGSSWVDV